MKGNKLILYVMIFVIVCLLFFPYYEVYKLNVKNKELQKKYNELQSILNRPVGLTEHKSAAQTIKDLRAYIEKLESQLNTSNDWQKTKNGVKYKIIN